MLLAGEPWLVRGAFLRRWTPAGYAESRPGAEVASGLEATPDVIATQETELD